MCNGRVDPRTLSSVIDLEEWPPFLMLFPDVKESQKLPYEVYRSLEYSDSQKIII